MHVHSNSMYINFIAVHVDRIPAFVLAIGIFGIWHIIIIIIIFILFYFFYYYQQKPGHNIDKW